MNIFRNKNFLLLWMGQIFEQFGDSLNLMALIAWAITINDKSSSNSIYISLLMFWLGLPIIILGPFAGIWVDRIKKKLILQLAAVLRGSLVFILFMIIVSKENLYFVFLIVFLISIVTQFFIPAKSSFIPEIVSKEELLLANSISATTTIIIQIFSYAIGGILVSEIGIQKTLFINVLTYIISFTTLSFINVEEKINKKIKVKVKEVYDDLKQGFLFILKEKDISFIVRRVFILMITVGFFYIAFTGSFIKDVLKNSNMTIPDIKAIGLMQGFLGLGLICGIFFIEKIVKKISPFKIIKILFPFIGILIFIFYFYKNFYYMLFMAFSAGISGVIILSIAETIIQKITPEHLRGRIFAAYYVLRNIGIIIATILTGFVVTFIKEPEIILSSGLILIIYGIINFLNKIKIQDIRVEFKIIFKGGPWVK